MLICSIIWLWENFIYNPQPHHQTRTSCCTGAAALKCKSGHSYDSLDFTSPPAGNACRTPQLTSPCYSNLFRRQCKAKWPRQTKAERTGTKTEGSCKYLLFGVIFKCLSDYFFSLLELILLAWKCDLGSEWISIWLGEKECAAVSIYLAEKKKKFMSFFESCFSFLLN